MIENFLNPEFVEALGWTLLHSLWQGAAFAICLAVIFIGLRSYSAQARYIVASGLLIAFFLTAATTFWMQWQQANSQINLATTESTPSQLAEDFTFNDPSKNAVPLSFESDQNPPIQEKIGTSYGANWMSTFSNYYERHLPLLVTIWLLGVLFLQLRFLGQLAYVQRLKHYGTELFPKTWSNKIEVLENKLRIQKKVSYLTSMRVESPMVIGWLQPVVLLPRHLFKSLTETEIYAVLAHELAHIRREDFVVNLLQTFLCNVFFFHPGVWWMSHQIDDEREHCCDDLAIAVTGPASSYAKTLINVSEFRLNRQQNTPLAMALNGKDRKRDRGGFTSRIRRLFMVENGIGTFKEGFATAIILMTALFLGFVATGHTVQSADSPLLSEIETEILAKKELLIKKENESEPFKSNTNSDIIQPIESPVKPNNPATPISPMAPVKPHASQIDDLIMACGEGNLDFVKTLIASGIDINSVGTEYFTPLIMAASENEVEIVNYLLSKGADVNQISNDWTALIEAADEGSLASMERLLKAGAEVNYYTSLNSPTAITIAASEGHLDCLKLLLAYGADINGIGKSVPPLHIAAEEGNDDIIDFLISQKVKINHQDATGRTALMYATSEGNILTIKKLIKAGGDISIVDLNGATVRDYAEEEREYKNLEYLENDHQPASQYLTEHGLVEKVQHIVDRGADVNTPDEYGRTPLHIVAAKNHTIDIRILIGLGADINVQDHQGKTPLMYATTNGNKDAAVLLVSERADVNIKDADGMRALEWARSGGNSGLENFLRLITETNPQENEIEINNSIKKADLKKLKLIEKNQYSIKKSQPQKDSQHQHQHQQQEQQRDDEEKTTKFLQAVQRGSIKECRQLLNNGVNINTTDNTGQTALMIAVKSNHLDQAKYLIENGADVTKSTVNGLTALHFAALENHDQMAQLLLENWAKIDAPMHYFSTDGNDGKNPVFWEYIGATPLFVAVESGNLATVSVLLDAGANPDFTLTKKEYRMKKGSQNYLSLSQVIGHDQDFLKDAKVLVSDYKWTPFRQAKQINDLECLALFSL